MTNATLNGKPYAGNPHVRFEVGGSRIGKPRRGSLLYKQFLVGVLVVCATVVFADDAPHWIGLDTTLRDQKTWVAPTETACAASLDTRIYDVLSSVGETIRGVFTGLFFIVK